MPLRLFKCVLYYILAGHIKYKLNKMRHHTLSINYHNIKRFYSFALMANCEEAEFKDCLQSYSECE